MVLDDDDGFEITIDFAPLVDAYDLRLDFYRIRSDEPMLEDSMFLGSHYLVVIPPAEE